MRAVGTIAAIVSLVGLGGCIIPMPIPASGVRVDVEAAELVIGETNRQTVHERLGQPADRVGERYEVFSLLRDPAHMETLIIIVGPGGGGGAGSFRGGGVVAYALVVGYDEDDLVSDWRWLDSAGRFMASGDPAIEVAAATFEKHHDWAADEVRLPGDGTARLFDFAAPDRLELETIDLADGRVVERLVGDATGCRPAVSMSRGAAVAFSVPTSVDAGFISVPRRIDAAVLPCRWTPRIDGHLAVERLDAYSGRPAIAQPVGTAIVVWREAGGGLFDLAGMPIAASGDFGRPERVTGDPAARFALLRMSSRSSVGTWQPNFWRVDRESLAMQELPAITEAARGKCFDTINAIAPDGRHVALGCPGHVRVWELADDAKVTSLAAVLPVPAGADSGLSALAFSGDGARLIRAGAGLVVWDTADWRVLAYRPLEETTEPRAPLVFTVSKDGREIATAFGLWRMVPRPAVAPTAASAPPPATR